MIGSDTDADRTAPLGQRPPREGLRNALGQANLSPAMTGLLLALLAAPVVAYAVDHRGLLIVYLLCLLGAGLAAMIESTRNHARLSRIDAELEDARRQAQMRESAWRQTAAQLGTRTGMIEHAPVGMLLADQEGDGLRVSYVNPAFCDQTGFTPDQLIGSGMAVLFGPETSVQSVNALRAAVADVQKAELELALHRRDGTALWVRLLLYPSTSDHQATPHYVAFSIDMSELRESEQERQRLAGELHESMKLESLGLTIASIAHDLNTPIGVAITAASHAEQVAQQFTAEWAEVPPSPEEVQRFGNRLDRSLELLSTNLNKAAVLVRSFKQTTADASRLEWRSLNLKAFLDTILVSMSPLMKRAGCEVHLACPETLQLHTEPGSLGRALTNLLINATIHAFEGRDDRRISVAVTRSPGRIRITCADNGVGMSEEAVSKAFTPFFTSKRSSGGSGLGLFSSRRTVEQVLGGKLTMSSELGAGTSFHIDLPMSAHDHDNA